MNRRPVRCGRTTRLILSLLGLLLILPAGNALAADTPRRPNILFILADDLGYGDLGCYGQKQVQTPTLDRLAREGMRFTQCYAGCTVCAPSRCTLMTGLHTGHCQVRGNAKYSLKPETRTVAEVLRSAGYVTGVIGKWGLGDPGSTGLPPRKGFDYSFGYLTHVHAHNYYPDHLYRNGERVEVPGNVVKDGVASKKVVYAPDLFTTEALAFLERQGEKPFFLYLSYTSPHANNEAGRVGGNGMEVPDDAPYSDRKWPQAQKNHAAMITPPRPRRRQGAGEAPGAQDGREHHRLLQQRQRPAQGRRGRPQVLPERGPPARLQARPDRGRHPGADDRPLAGEDQGGHGQ